MTPPESSELAASRVVLGDEGLRLGDERVPLLSGALHYFQTPREHWARSLDALAELGLPLVESYLPWSVHERAPGDFQFDGAGERDLGGFLDACAERGLRVLLRPGPHVNAELSGFGYPARLLGDPRCQALGPTGAPVILPVPPRAFAVPSYASQYFLEEAERWLGAVAGFLRGRSWPDGPLVGVQVDNECCYFFRTAAYDQDYHPDALVLYRSFLTGRYPGGLPAGYPSGQGELEPPRRFQVSAPEELVPHLDWVAFKESLITSALRRLAASLRAGGLDRLPLYHNLPPAELGGGAVSLPAVEAELDAVGLDLYARRTEYASVKRSLLRQAGSSRFPYIAELGWGGWPWWFPLLEEDSQATMLAALMHGARGFNIYMAVERDRWFGAPVGPTGQRRTPGFEALRRIVAAVKEARLPSLRRPAAAGLLRVREYERLALVSSLLDPVPPSATALIGLGPEDLCAAELPGLPEAAPAYARFFRLAQAALEAEQLPYELVDSEVAPQRLQRYPLLICPSLELIDEGLLESLSGYVSGGGRLLLGPRRPERDVLLRPLARPLPEHRLVGESELAAALIEELGSLGAALPPKITASGGAEVAVYREGTAPRVLFVAHRGPPVRAAIAVSGAELAGLRAWDALSGAPADLGRLIFAPAEIRMLRLQPRSEEGAP